MTLFCGLESCIQESELSMCSDIEVTGYTDVHHLPGVEVIGYILCTITAHWYYPGDGSRGSVLHKLAHMLLSYLSSLSVIYFI